MSRKLVWVMDASPAVQERALAKSEEDALLARANEQMGLAERMPPPEALAERDREDVWSRRTREHLRVEEERLLSERAEREQEEIGDVDALWEHFRPFLVGPGQ